MGSIPGSGRHPRGGQTLQYPCLWNPTDRDFWATVQGVAKSQTQLKQLIMHVPIPFENINLRETHTNTQRDMRKRCTLQICNTKVKKKSDNNLNVHQICCCLVSKSCLILCDLMDCSPLGSSVHGDSPGKNTGEGNHFLLQGIFLTQGLNTHLLHCQEILYH